MKRAISLFLLVGMLASMLAACGGGGQIQPTATPQPATQATTAPAPTAAPQPTTAAPAQVIKIATQGPLSGGQAALGTGMKNAAELAVKQLSGPLTELGFRVELAPFDDQAKPEVGSANAKNIVSDPDILCVVGHLNSGVALAALPDYKNARLAMVSPANTNLNITEGGYEVAFRVVGRDDVQSSVAEKFAREELKIKSVYIIHDTTAYGQGVAEFFRKAAEANGIQVLGFEGTEEKSDFSAILTPILAANPDLIFFGGIYDQAGPFFRQARDRGITAQFMGPDGLDSEELVKLAGDAVDKMYYTSVAPSVSQFPDAAKYASDYKAAYGENAPSFSAQAYDATGICLTAIANAAKAAGGKPTREQVLNEIKKLSAYKGITGTYTFNEKGDPTVATYFVLQVNAADWNSNRLVSRLEIAPPGSETAGGATGGGTTEFDLAALAAQLSTVAGKLGTIKIATQGPLSGGQAALGTGMKNAVELAIEEINSQLSALGVKFEVVPFDDQAKPEVGSANAKNIVSDPDILCVVGHLNSGVALAALPDYKNARLAMVSPANTNLNITEGGYEVAFRVVGRDDVQSSVAEKFAREELKIKSVYIIHDTTAYGQGVAEFFRKAAEANGIQVLGFEGTEEKSDFSAILTPILAANPDLIFFGGIYDQAGPFFRQARDRGITAQFMGPDGLDSEELVKLAGDAVDKMYYTSVAPSVSQFPDAAKYASDYKAAYGENAPSFSAQAYDAANICAAGILSAAITAGGKPTRAQVLEAIRNLPPFPGITGTFKFNAKGDPTVATYFVLQVNAADWNQNKLISRLEIAPPQ
ncbi:branched-chain amino acid ABC transporter substrate-binding protein [Chloroflexus sp.]|uniref:branched-chain amino acid ABC transporter substrate-binding protein n=1 Tax=Chloroflexus sp. TaxID=1904827 RepID=UPI003C77A070